MKKQTGYNLIELMIAMLLGFIVVGGVLSIFISTIQSSSDTIKSARLNHDLGSVAQLMVNELRRAGYWGGAKVGEDTLVNPFMIDGANITIEDYAGTDDCILYSYDADNSAGLLVDANEYFGFRHNGDGIDMRLSVGSTSSVSCADTATWGNIIDTDKLKITNLTFSSANTKCFNVTQNAECSDVTAVTDDRIVETRQILITLEGEVLSDSDVEKNYRLDGSNDNRIRVKVRNNRIFYSP